MRNALGELIVKSTDIFLTFLIGWVRLNFFSLVMDKI